MYAMKYKETINKRQKEEKDQYCNENWLEIEIKYNIMCQNVNAVKTHLK